MKFSSMNKPFTKETEWLGTHEHILHLGKKQGNQNETVVPLAHMKKEEVQLRENQGQWVPIKSSRPSVWGGPGLGWVQGKLAAGTHLWTHQFYCRGRVPLNWIIKNGFKYLNSGILIEVRKNLLVHQEGIGWTDHRTSVEFFQNQSDTKVSGGGAECLLCSCPALCDPTGCSPPGSSVHGILKARIQEWVAVSFSRVPSWPRDQTCVSDVSCTGRRILYHWA